MDMGKAMSTAFVHMKKAFYKYNASSRALKYIEKEKLPVAPRHETTGRIVEQLKSENAVIFNELTKKHENLDLILKEVYLKSTGENQEIKAKKSLPQNRDSREEYMFIEPEVVPEGFIVLSKLVKFLHDHNADSELWSATKIAKYYQLDKDKVDIILKYYGTYTVMESANEDESGEITPLGEELILKFQSLLPSLAKKPLEPKDEKFSDKDQEPSRIEGGKSLSPKNVKRQEAEPSKEQSANN